MSSQSPPPPPKVEYPTSVDRPDLTTRDGHTVGVDNNNGSTYVDTTTGHPINDSDVHTRFSGTVDHHDVDGGDFLDHVVDAVTDSCLVM